MSIKLINSLLNREFFYSLFITSGYIKPYLSFLGLQRIDFNIIIGSFLLVDVFINLFRFKKEKKIEIYQSVGVILFFLFCISIMLSLLYTKSEEYFFSKLLSFGVCAVSYLYPIFIYKFNILRFFTIFSNLACFIAGFFILIYYFTSKVFPLSELIIFQDLYLIIGFLCGINILFYFIGLNKNIFKLIFFCTILLFSSARAALLFTSLLVLLLTFKNFLLTNFKINFKSTFYLFTFTFLFFVFNSQSQFGSDMIDKTASRILILFSSNEKGGSSAQARINHITKSINLISEKPLLGHGFGSYGYVTLGQDIRSYPHNSVLEVWLELGFLGVVTFFTFIFFHFYQCIYRYDFNTGILILYLMLNSLTSNTFSEFKLEFCFLAIFLLKNKVNFRKIRI